jgi:hypothetical protein
VQSDDSEKLKGFSFSGTRVILFEQVVCWVARDGTLECGSSESFRCRVTKRQCCLRSTQIQLLAHKRPSNRPLIHPQAEAPHDSNEHTVPSRSAPRVDRIYRTDALLNAFSWNKSMSTSLTCRWQSARGSRPWWCTPPAAGSQSVRKELTHPCSFTPTPPYNCTRYAFKDRAHRSSAWKPCGPSKALDCGI